jgi:hypothetical protein
MKRGEEEKGEGKGEGKRFEFPRWVVGEGCSGGKAWEGEWHWKGQGERVHFAFTRAAPAQREAGHQPTKV